MMEFTFQATLLASIRVKADTEAEAELKLRAALTASEANLGMLDDTPIVVPVEIEGDLDLSETIESTTVRSDRGAHASLRTLDPRRYLANALSSRFAKPPRADRRIVTWIESHSHALGLPEPRPRASASSRRAAAESPMQAAQLESVARRGDRHGPRARRQILRRFKSASTGLPTPVRSAKVQSRGARAAGASDADAPGPHSRRRRQRSLRRPPRRRRRF